MGTPEASSGTGAVLVLAPADGVAVCACAPMLAADCALVSALAAGVGTLATLVGWPLDALVGTGAVETDWGCAWAALGVEPPVTTSKPVARP
jgi:hypothetical protein